MVGLFSPDEIKIEMKKKQGNPTAHEMDKTMLLTHRFFQREKVDEVGVPPLFSLPSNYANFFGVGFRLFARRSTKKRTFAKAAISLQREKIKIPSTKETKREREENALIVASRKSG